MDCGNSLVKYVLFLFNSLCSIFGILLVVYGSIALDGMGYINRHGDIVYGPQAILPMLTITLGSVIVFISFLGSCGAIRESYCMLMMYATLLLLLLIVQLLVVISLWANTDQFLEGVGKVVEGAWQERDAGIMGALEKSLGCCGVTGPTDYVLAKFTLPPSTCCKYENCADPLNIYVFGCKSKLRDVWSGESETVKKGGLVLVTVEFLGFVFASSLANNIRNLSFRRVRGDF